jgi:hypothetical protein
VLLRLRSDAGFSYARFRRDGSAPYPIRREVPPRGLRQERLTAPKEDRI